MGLRVVGASRRAAAFGRGSVLRTGLCLTTGLRLPPGLQEGILYALSAFIYANLLLLRRFCLFEADPSCAFGTALLQGPACWGLENIANQVQQLIPCQL